MLRLHSRFNLITAGLLACFLINSYVWSATPEEISQNPVWLKLLHYREGSSEIDDDSFFLSRNGKTDPLGELKATLEAFETSREKGDRHPVCRYPARYLFLKKYFDIKPSVKPECRELSDFLKEVRPSSVSFVFSDYYINSPASMYGHTFLRIDPPFKSPLLGYAVNYAANADRAEGILYYIKGLTGGYKGFYSIFPYYKKIFEYSHLESRNLWEYRLNLSQEDARFIALHVWELRDHYSYYYFFDKNCSYQILYLIDIVRPELNLTERFSRWTIPVETIREIENAGLITEKHFRPSATTLINSFVKSDPTLTEEDIKKAKSVALLQIPPEEILNSGISEEKKGKILELSKLLFMYYSIKNRIEHREYRKKLLKILRARSKIHYRVKPYIKKPSPPEEGHRPQKISLLWGTDQGKKFTGFVYRTAYHSLEDDDTGYMEGSEVIFPSIRVINYPDLNKTVVDRLTFVKITSMAERNIVFRPVSWGVDFSVERRWDRDRKIPFTVLDVMAGFTHRIWDSLVFYGISTAGEVAVSRINHSRVYSGPEIITVSGRGIFKTVSRTGAGLMLTKNGLKTAFKFSLSGNIKTGRNSSLTLSGRLDRVFYKTRYLLQFSVNIFF